MQQSLMTLNRRRPLQQDCSSAMNWEKPTGGWKGKLLSASFWGPRSVLLAVAADWREWGSKSDPMDVAGGRPQRTMGVRLLFLFILRNWVIITSWRVFQGGFLSFLPPFPLPSSCHPSPFLSFPPKLLVSSFFLPLELGQPEAGTKHQLL